MTITKAEIITRICGKTHLSNDDTFRIVESTFEILKASLERGEQVKISGFATFAVRTKHSRRGRNPQTGAEMVIPQHRVLMFKPSSIMKKAVNDTGAALHKTHSQSLRRSMTHARS